MFVYVICSVIFLEQLSAQPFNSDRQSSGEPGARLFVDSGYGSRVETGSRLAKWQEMSKSLYGKYGPGRKRNVPLENGGQGIRIIDRPTGYGYDTDYDDFEMERELKNRQSFYKLRLFCLDLLEELWKKYNWDVELSMEMKQKLDYICS